MHITARKDFFSRAVVRAVAAAAGIDATVPEHDQNSKDIHFTAPDSSLGPGPELAAQLKCSETVRPEGQEFTYDLPVHNYDHLRHAKLYVPRILIVVHVPGDPGEWVASDADRIILKRCAYWVSLAGAPTTTNTSTVAVKIPTEQVFDVKALLDNLRPPGAAL